MYQMIHLRHGHKDNKSERPTRRICPTRKGSSRYEWHDIKGFRDQGSRESHAGRTSGKLKAEKEKAIIKASPVAETTSEAN
jgi:hypothetical protein